MNNGVIAVEVTRFVVQHCERIKFEFKQKLTELLSIESNRALMNQIPIKRKREPEIEESEEEFEYKTGTFETKTEKIVESKLKSESESEEHSQILTVNELEFLISALKSSKVEKKDVQKISCFLDSYPSMGLKERSELKRVLEKFDNLKVSKDDLLVKTLFSELQGKVKKIFSSTLIEEDWENIETRLFEALKENNKEKIGNIVKRINNAFPDKVNERIKEELAGLEKLLKKVVKRVEGNETKMKAVNILKKFGNVDEAKVATMDVEKIAKKFDFGGTDKKLINTVDAGKTVPGRKRR